MNAIELLESQHREVETLFRKIEKAAGPEKEDLFDQIADALAIHASIEEKHFYPATRSQRTEDDLREAVEEHLSIKRIIADLLECDPEDPQFEAKVIVLKEQVEHHVKEEEEELFPKVKAELSADQLDDLAVVMDDLASELRESGPPREQVPGETARAARLE